MAKFNQALSDLYSYGAALAPQTRTGFGKGHSVSTTFDSAYLIPVQWDRVLPGDEKKIRVSALARMATPIHPTMDEAFLYTWCVYVPDRLWWNHAKEFYGENKYASFNPDGEYVMPHLTPSKYCLWKGDRDGDYLNAHGPHSLNDYLGMPYVSGSGVPSEVESDPDNWISAGLHRSYQLIWNELFRNTSIQPALQLNFGNTVTSEEWEVISQLRKVNKLPDQFTTLLREPQAGDDVLLPIAEYLPVVSRNVFLSDEEFESMRNIFVQAKREDTIAGQDLAQVYFGHFNGADVNSRNGYLLTDQNATADMATTDVNKFNFANLWAHTDPYVGSINSLRQAVVIQHLLEIDNTAGKRYQSLIQAHFGVFIPDSTVQRPELLGASRTYIGMRSVVQNSATNDVSPQGNTAAVSVTNLDNEWICDKAFTEPGFIFILSAIRPAGHSYSQGIDPLLRKLRRYDHYYPAFDNIGNQPVYTSEIFADYNAQDGDDHVARDVNTRVFGWKEAWNEYKTRANRVSGLMRPDAPQSLASWNYSDYYSLPPVLDQYFIQEDESLIDRTIAVPSEPQFIADFYFDYFDVKSMSLHSTPGVLTL